MISLTEPVQLSEYFFVDEQIILSILESDKEVFGDNLEKKYKEFRSNFPYLPPHLAHESSPLWKKFDEFLALKPSEVWSINFSTDYELTYYRSQQELDNAIQLVSDFTDSLFEELKTHNPKFVEHFLILAQNIPSLKNAHESVLVLFMPFFTIGYHAYLHWEEYSKNCLYCINYAINRKRHSLELQYIVTSTDTRFFRSYDDFKKVVDSYDETKKQIPILTSTDIITTSFPDTIAHVVTELIRHNEVLYPILLTVFREIKKSQRYAYHEKKYSFGYFEENGTFHYTGRMNALAFILDEVELKGWSSCGDKVQLLLQHISIKGKVSTLKRYFEGVVSKRADFTKASFHDEAVGLLNAIIKNCE